ncbi:hypothetical protein BFJ66_g222 [Fusarium oxysporum f. sp. cepae]|uniref:Uncharacterized protein n=1 Tax=Fusarium oxysporum f. sp. cepae TaxID=396571 RepID=A0A3L6P3E5_FUSOX|nr:hypothetical protein BFJ65_g4083 [Fusarium oxysporum f. sp. cepae]RKK59152.1 hypothetical protein BFJ67_g2682 [Fusarium oxysporum f. sp. cepae]RKK64330.1 hypothetical protein BFJ66_g222 [Fusarium oxysporum f. sp. cepae]
MLLNNLSIAFSVPLALAATPLGGGRWKKVKPSLNPQHCVGGQIKGDRISLKQTLENKGVWFMLAADKSGNLYGVGGRGMIAQGVAKVGATVTVNTIHDADTGLYKVYINGQEKYSTTSPQDVWRDKFGAYATSSGSGPITVTWNDVEFYTR